MLHQFRILIAHPFCALSVLEVRLAPHTDPITGDEHEVMVNLPKGFIFQTAHAVKTAVMRILSPNLNFEHSGRNAFCTTVSYDGHSSNGR
jgi:hypothetical protein